MKDLTAAPVALLASKVMRSDSTSCKATLDGVVFEVDMVKTERFANHRTALAATLLVTKPCLNPDATDLPCYDANNEGCGVGSLVSGRRAIVISLVPGLNTHDLHINRKCQGVPALLEKTLINALRNYSVISIHPTDTLTLKGVRHDLQRQARQPAGIKTA